MGERCQSVIPVPDLAFERRLRIPEALPRTVTPRDTACEHTGVRRIAPNAGARMRRQDRSEAGSEASRCSLRVRGNVLRDPEAARPLAGVQL